MKTLSKKSTDHGFTLIELLVVIAIIVVLAAASFAIGPPLMDKARRLAAQSVATSVASAVEQFYSEYSALPDVGSGTQLSTGADGAGVEVLEILMAQETEDSPQNTRKIRFFSAKEAKGTSKPKDGAVYSSENTIRGLYDPWGQPYYIELDDDYDDELRFTPYTNKTVTLRGRRVAVYSLGVGDVTEANEGKLAKSW